jgi:hypothetical protein
MIPIVCGSNRAGLFSPSATAAYALAPINRHLTACEDV